MKQETLKELFKVTIAILAFAVVCYGIVFLLSVHSKREDIKIAEFIEEYSSDATWRDKYNAQQMVDKIKEKYTLTESEEELYYSIFFNIRKLGETKWTKLY